MKNLSVNLLYVILALVLAGCQVMPAQAPRPTLTPIPLPALADTVAAPPKVSGTPATGLSATPAIDPTSSVPSPTPVPVAAPETRRAVQPPRLLTLGQHATIALRNAPVSGAAVAANVPGSTVLWAEGISEDGRWLLVRYDESAVRAWANRGDVSLFGDIAALPVTGPDGTPRAAPATQVAPPGGPTLPGQALVNELNVRSGPGIDQPAVGVLKAGDAVMAVGRTTDGQWLQIRWQGGLAWVAARFVAIDEDRSDLPETAQASSPVPAAGNLPSAPTGASGTGKIVFQLATGGDIYIVNGNGSGLRRLTTGIDPLLSPDSTRVAFSRWGAPQEGVFIIDLRTGQEKQVAPGRQPRGVTWSPDGTRLVFSYVTRAYTCFDTPFGCLDEEAVRRVFGSNECLDTPFGRLCLGDYPLREMVDRGMAHMDLRDGNWENVPVEQPVQSPAWDPQSNDILYRVNKGLQITSFGGQTRPFVSENQFVQSPTWSPDGQRIAVQIRVHDHFDIFLLDRTGNVQSRLTAPEPLARRAINNVAPAWSPDGRGLLFLSDRSGAWQLYRMDADGSNQAPFLPDTLKGLAFRYDYAAERVASWGR